MSHPCLVAVSHWLASKNWLSTSASCTPSADWKIWAYLLSARALCSCCSLSSIRWAWRESLSTGSSTNSMFPSLFGLKKPASYIELATYAIGSACCNLSRASWSSYSICSMRANLSAVYSLCSYSRCLSSAICCLERLLLAAAFISELLLPLETEKNQRISIVSSE